LFCVIFFYSFTKGQQAIRDITRAMIDKTGNLPLFPGIFPDYSAPIVRNSAAGRELTLARWGMPSPVCRRTRSLIQEDRAEARQGLA